ncbi:hypothetical protein [Bradyrhizobium icense]|uniref:Uncharacterized protein n=1 Tax=Bradyrhizobium icense TaxID=1274631 RepID=A0A1B1UD72_9BRAD|nr:hypothetical protein [Bradyrhizobium icense]ANW00703.1 hypothetical protein LMTR13_11495 [Bradyrhizobium icense]
MAKIHQFVTADKREAFAEAQFKEADRLAKEAEKLMKKVVKLRQSANRLLAPRRLSVIRKRRMLHHERDD